MTILVDAGNSRVKWAWWSGDRIDVGEPFATDSRALHGRLRALWNGLPAPQAVYVSNVAGPDWERQFIAWVRAAWNLDIRLVRSQARGHGIFSGYLQPESLGVDRWVGLIGARWQFGLPFCLVDCGTAITVDLVDAEGRHRGGLIAAGLRLMQDALLQRAPGVATGGGVFSGRFWGISTAEGLESGAREMVLGLIDRAFQQARATLGMEPALILTGGDGELLAPHVTVPFQLDPHLVLQGLAAIARNECSAALRG
ncbi:MAG: type III pantothenate kinase [Methylotetracoccus sp.]|nr:type III pantothenate kinase [Methylotetracoccus sp.]